MQNQLVALWLQKAPWESPTVLLLDFRPILTKPNQYYVHYVRTTLSPIFKFRTFYRGAYKTFCITYQTNRVASPQVL